MNIITTTQYITYHQRCTFRWLTPRRSSRWTRLSTPQFNSRTSLFSARSMAKLSDTVKGNSNFSARSTDRFEESLSTMLRTATTLLICLDSPLSLLMPLMSHKLSLSMSMKELHWLVLIHWLSPISQGTSFSLIVGPLGTTKHLILKGVSLWSTCSSKVSDLLLFARSRRPQDLPSVMMRRLSIYQRRAKTESFVSTNPKKASITWGTICEI